MPPKFLYFDLGKVLVDFTVERMLRQVAQVAGLDESRVKQVLFDSKLQRQYESGQVTSRQFYDAFCDATLSRLVALSCTSFPARSALPSARICAAK